MAGIQHDTLSDIQEIRRLLDGYSEGFAFIKELIQNAEDAEANEIHLVWHRGMAGRAEHPLLQGPALLVLNDGPFEQKHREGLMRMGLGSKAAEEDRIGRFGLGMKAVFHVCEGGPLRRFMYLATVACDTSWPSSASSALIRGAPHPTLSLHIRRINARISTSISGRPPFARDFQRQQCRKPWRCHRRTVSGFTKTRADLQPAQLRASQIQNIRSCRSTRGRLDRR